MYKLIFHLQVKKQAKKLHPQDQKRFIKIVSRLEKSPFSRSLDIKRLVNTRSGYRLRIGDFRVLYSINKKEKIICVWEVDYRGGIY
ncbi:MAG: type II toxin-antitoxin system RelE/ParE family toxin [Patescibacteria group bacterium]